MNAADAHKTAAEARKIDRIVQALDISAFGLMAISQAFLWAMGIYAWRHRLYPYGPFDAQFRGGPWTHEPVLDGYLQWSLYSFVASVVLFLWTLVLKPRIRALIFFGFYAVTAFIYLYIGVVLMMAD
ncbi:MAG TPA: hypothetical protein VF719_07080 [Abditibacteriaceae bacterium]|jgi:hypothetical protein